MLHKLRVIPRLTAQSGTAELRIVGFFTTSGSFALRALIRRATSISGVRTVLVDLTMARRVDQAAVRVLNQYLHPSNYRSGQHPFIEVRILMPAFLPGTPGEPGSVEDHHTHRP